MTISHVGISVTDSAVSRAFYERALEPLGITVTTVMAPDQTQSGGTAIGFGTADEPGFFWIGDNERVGEGFHLAFSATRREQVDAFHRAAIAARGTDNGPPGLRPHYADNYYAAFVLDPDGHNIEVVCLADE